MDDINEIKEQISANKERTEKQASENVAEATDPAESQAPVQEVAGKEMSSRPERTFIVNGIQYLSEEKGYLVSIETSDGKRGFLYKKGNEETYEIRTNSDGVVDVIDNRELARAFENSRIVKEKTITLNPDAYEQTEKNTWVEKANPDHSIVIVGQIPGTDLISVREYYSGEQDERSGSRFVLNTPEISKLLSITPAARDAGAQKPAGAPGARTASNEAVPSEDPMAYEKAVGTLERFMKDRILSQQETADLRTVSGKEQQSEYVMIAKHHLKLSEAALEKGDDKAFEKHAAIANLAGIIDRKIESNSLADGELTKLTDKLLGRVEDKASEVPSQDKTPLGLAPADGVPSQNRREGRASDGTGQPEFGGIGAGIIQAPATDYRKKDDRYTALQETVGGNVADMISSAMKEVEMLGRKIGSIAMGSLEHIGNENSAQLGASTTTGNRVAAKESQPRRP